MIVEHLGRRFATARVLRVFRHTDQNSPILSDTHIKRIIFKPPIWVQTNIDAIEFILRQPSHTHWNIHLLPTCKRKYTQT